MRSDVTYTIGVTTGQNAVTGATVTDALPSGASLLSATPSTGSCTVSTNLVCNLGNLPAGDLETIVVKVHANSGGKLANSASLSTTSADPDPSNNSATVQTAVDNPCTVPGVTLVTDPSGDESNQLPVVRHPELLGGRACGLGAEARVHAQDGEPRDGAAEHDVAGALQLRQRRDRCSAQWFVAMKTDPLGTVSYRYGTGNASTNGTGNLDAGSGFTPDGTITLVISDSKLAPAQGGPLAAGKSLTGFLSRIRLETRRALPSRPTTRRTASPGPASTS